MELRSSSLSVYEETIAEVLATTKAAEQVCGLCDHLVITIDHHDFDWRCVCLPFQGDGQFVIDRTARYGGRDAFFLFNKKQNGRKKARGNKI